MEYENREVFTQASGKIGPAQLKELSAQTLFINDPLFGGDVRYQYRRLGPSMQARVEVAGNDLRHLQTGFGEVREILSGNKSVH